MAITDKNLIALPSVDYKAGQRFVKVGQKYMPVGVGSIVEPGGVLPGGGNSFYKCASVDSTNKTWMGYKAVQDSTTGVWSYESVLTTDELTFDKVTPSVNGIYTADATCEIKKLFNGVSPVFYAPLNAAASTAVTGQALTSVGSITYQTINGIPCAYFNWSEAIYTPNEDDKLAFGSTGSMSLWAYTPQVGTNYNKAFGGIGIENATGRSFNLLYAYDHLKVDKVGSSLTDDSGIGTRSNWVHLVVVTNNGTTKIYRNNTLSKTESFSINCTGKQICIGSLLSGTSSIEGEYRIVGYIAAVRVYDIALTEDMISELYSEFGN